jgi:hypothetical protein
MATVWTSQVEIASGESECSTLSGGVKPALALPGRYKAQASHISHTLATKYLLLVFQEIGEGNREITIIERSKETGQHEDLDEMARHLEEISSCMSRNCQPP